jgi:hypothetical protein
MAGVNWPLFINAITVSVCVGVLANSVVAGVLAFCSLNLLAHLLEP